MSQGTKTLFNSLNAVDDNEPLRLRDERKNRLAQQIRRQSKTSEIIVKIDVEKETAHVDMSADPPEVVISGRKFDQPATDFPEEEYHWLCQRVLATHEALHIRFTHHRDFMYRLNKSDINLSKETISDVHNAFEDVGIEEIGRDTFKNISILFLLFRANLFYEKPPGFEENKSNEEKTETRSVTLISAIQSKILEYGAYDGGFTRKLLDENNDEYKFAFDDERDTFLEIEQYIESTVDQVINEYDGMRRNRIIFEFLSNIEDYISEKSENTYEEKEKPPGNMTNDSSEGDSGKQTEKSNKNESDSSEQEEDKSEKNSSENEQKENSSTDTKKDQTVTDEESSGGNGEDEQDKISEDSSEGVSDNKDDSSEEINNDTGFDGSDSIEDGENSRTGHGDNTDDSKEKSEDKDGNSTNTVSHSEEQKQDSKTDKIDRDKQSGGNCSSLDNSIETEIEELEEKLSNDIEEEKRKRGLDEEDMSLEKECNQLENIINGAGLNKTESIESDLTLQENTWEKITDEGNDLFQGLTNILPVEKTGWKDNQEEGFISPQSITRAIQGHADVRMKKSKPDKTHCNIVFGIDRSSSMRRHIKTAEIGYGMFSYGMDSIESSMISIDVMNLELRQGKVKIAVPFHQHVKNVPERIAHGKCGGGTPIEEMLQLATERLRIKETGNDINLIIIISDDLPARKDKYIKMINNCPYPVIGFSITDLRSEDMEEAYDTYIKAGTTKKSVVKSLTTYAEDIALEIQKLIEY